RDAVEVEREDIDPAHRRIGGEEILGLGDGEGRIAHAARPLDAILRTASPKRRNSSTDTGLVLACHSGCHCTPNRKGWSPGPRTASTRPSSAWASAVSGGARRWMPCQWSELTMISSRPIQDLSVPESFTGCAGPKR